MMLLMDASECVETCPPIWIGWVLRGFCSVSVIAGIVMLARAILQAPPRRRRRENT